jgi:hypothetical protein
MRLKKVVSLDRAPWSGQNYGVRRREKMKKAIWILTPALVFAIVSPGFSTSFKVYPGAKLEAVYEAKQSGTGPTATRSPKVIVFTTNDLFENVVAFYRGIAREYRVPGMGRNPVKLPSGQELKEAYFILDGASDLSTSEHWIKIQRPYLDQGNPGGPFYGKNEKARDVTAIIEEDKRTYH